MFCTKERTSGVLASWQRDARVVIISIMQVSNLIAVANRQRDVLRLDRCPPLALGRRARVRRPAGIHVPAADVRPRECLKRPTVGRRRRRWSVQRPLDACELYPKFAENAVDLVNERKPARYRFARLSRKQGEVAFGEAQRERSV